MVGLMAQTATLRGVLKRKPVVGWALYDWANSAFATTVMAGFFPVFYSAITQDISAEDSQFYFNITLAAASILIAVSAPILGAVSDRGGSRKKFLVFFASLGILMSAHITATQNGGLVKLMRISRRIDSIFMVTRLNTVFQVFDSEPEGLASFESDPPAATKPES